MMMNKLFTKGPVFMCFGGSSGGGSGDSGGGNDNDNTPAPVTNSFTESLANFFTPNDGASYVGGQLVDDNSGASISAGGTTSTGNVISGSANTSSNDRPSIVQPLGTLEGITASTPTPVIQVPVSPRSEFGNVVLDPNKMEIVNFSDPTNSTSGTIGALPTTNSTMEELANLMTPNDGAVYANGQLIDQFTGEVIEAGGLSSTGNTIRGTANTASNDMEDYMGYGSAPVVNTGRETLANIITPGDQAMYVDGQLVNTLTGESLEGGGYTIDPVTGMTQMQATAAIANQKMRQDIPPSDLAYFGSFLGNSVVPIFGGIIAEKMLMVGIDGRRAIIDEHTAALEAGATPIYNESGEYTGYEGEGGSVNYDFSPQEQVMAGPSYDGGVGGNDDDGVVTTSIGSGGNTGAANSIYNRYYKGGSGFGLPAWLRQYASGVSINQLLEKVMIEGKEYFKTPDGKYIEPSELAGTVDLGVEEAPA